MSVSSGCVRQRPWLQPRRGNVLVLVPTVALLFVSLALLAVDWGRVQVARGELQAAADAAALHAANGKIDSSAAERARSTAANNLAAGRPVSLASGDVVLGRWDTDTRSFTATSSQPNAVRITARGSVPLFFGSLVGREHVDVSATSTAHAGYTSSHGLVGLDYVRLNSRSSVDAYNSALGTYTATRSSGTSIASNGYIDINSRSELDGDAWHVAGQSVSVNGSASIISPGQVRVLPAPLQFPPLAVPPEAVNRGAYTQDGGVLKLTAGSYRYTDLVINSGARLEIEGDVTIYVTSKFEVNSSSTAHDQRPRHLTIVGLGNAMISVNSRSTLAADVYAPGGEVRVNSRSVLYGRAVGKSILVNSDSHVHHDKSLGEQLNSKPRLVQ